MSDRPFLPGSPVLFSLPGREYITLLYKFLLYSYLYKQKRSVLFGTGTIIIFNKIKQTKK